MQNQPLLYSFFGDFHDDGHAKAETRSRHIDCLLLLVQLLD